MSVVIYRDNDARAIFIEDANGAQFLNALHATLDLSTSKVSVTDTAKEIRLVSDIEYNLIVDDSGTDYGSTPTEVVNSLNAMFQASGSSSGNIPVITSSSSINSTEGDTINYELTADYGVGYEWSNLPAGLVTVEGNMRKLVGGSDLPAGTYTIAVKAINYFGFDQETLTINVANAAFSNSKSVQFQNQDWLEGNAALLSPVLGRLGNGSGSTDAWSISLFYKGSSANPGQIILYYGSGDISNSGYFHLMQLNSGGSKSLRLKYGTNNNNLRIQTNPGTIIPNTWHHILVTYDGGTTGVASGELNDYYSRFKIFIDNVEQSTNKSQSNIGYNGSMDSDNFRVGRFNVANHMRNGAKVDELAVWDSDQSSSISDIYNSGDPFDLTSLSTPPVHWWRMGDGDTFPVLEDSIGSADFTMRNMTVADIVNDVP